ncbi:alpha-2A adrenergic receptor-like [Littorina saxatilis]
MTSMAMTSAEPFYPAGYPSGYTWAHIICASVVVTLVILVIVVGNYMVMWAIWKDKNLKGTQNYFIGSLALADFLLGLLVVPFSLANELMGYWHFGTVFCEVWKAADVLLCTASINSLCLISLDRYWSITKALHYSRQRTPKRAAIMIFIVWFVSAAICIPPLIGWNQPAPDPYSDWPVCALSEDIGYVLYSSMGSFYIPAFIMVFVYFKIYQAAKARARKNVSKAPRGQQTDKSEQKNSTESSGTDQQQQQKEKEQQKQQLLQPEQPQNQQQIHGQSLENVARRHDDVVKENKENNHLKVHPLQSSSVDEVEIDDDEEERAVERHAVGASECRCANEILDDDLTPGLTSEDEGSFQRDRFVDFRTRSLSLPCRALRSDELTKLISTDSDSCDALLAGGPALNSMDRSRFGFYSMPTTTTDTDSSMDLPLPPPPSYPHHHHHQFQTYDTTTPTHTAINTATAAEFSHSNSSRSMRTNSPTNDSGVRTPVTIEAQTPQDNGAIQQFKIMEPKQNGTNADSSGGCATSSFSGDKDSTQNLGLFGSLKRQLFPNTNNGKVGGESPLKTLHKKKAHKKAARAGGGGDDREESTTNANKTTDFFSAERHKRKLAKARERRATLVLGVVMASFILCWLPFFLLYVVSAFCVGCIPYMVFTVFFWIGYCNSALNPIIYTVFNRDFRRAFQRILCGRPRGRR